MTVAISREQQKIFIDNFMAQVLDVALAMVAQGKDLGSPGETVHAVGSAVVAQLRGMTDAPAGEGDFDA